MIQISRKIYGWCLPPTCILCHYPTYRAQDLCQSCFDELPILPQSCHRCATILTSSDYTCGACLNKPPLANHTHVLFFYEPPITKLIMELKFHGNLVNAKILGEMMANAIKHQWYANKPLPDLIIPMPLHPKRLRERGFNQAVEICRPIAKALNIPIDAHNCTRRKHTLAQARQTAKDRRQNMRGAFQINRNYTDLHIAILDDVTTTGSTLHEFAQTLANTNPYQIDIWCCAKTLLRQ